ncbi:MAG: hypothetical protein N3F66_10670 [Spirochaetes bacterium]|nr:hypothetical protein [Spirochaetota bacterium]
MKNRNVIRKIVIVEIIAFFIVISFLWSEELFDLPYLLLNAEPTPVNYQESFLETIIFTIVFGVLVYHTVKVLLKLKRLESYIRICASCHKIYVEGKWIPLEKYFDSYVNRKTSHGLCDDCRKVNKY